MYFEEVEVKKYTTKNKKTGVERTSFQIHIKKGSKFREAKKIGLIDLSEIKEIEKELSSDYVKEQKTKLKELSEENVKLKQQLKEYKEKNNDLTSVNYNNQQELLTIKDKIEDLSTKLLHEKDLTKSLLVVRADFLKQNAISRFLKKEPESSKKISELKELPEVVDTNISKD